MAFVLSPQPPIADWLEDFDSFAKRSPGFFAGRPVVVDISAMPASRPELVHMVTELRRRNITIMGLDGRPPGELGADARGLPPILSGGKEIAGVVQMNAEAAAADHILPVNRIKPHTSFRGPVESGCTKMAVIGFGNAGGATVAHEHGPAALGSRLLDGVAVLRDQRRLLGGIAVLESARGEVADVVGLGPDDVGGPGERDLTDASRALLRRLPYPEIDVLIVERGGKDISGTLIDPNVTGRFWLPGIADLDAPRVGVIVLLSLTAASAGNAMGIGMVDLIPRSVAATIDWDVTYANARATGIGGLRRARCPMVLDDEAACLDAAVALCGRGDRPLRIARIDSTLHLDRLLVSDALR